MRLKIRKSDLPGIVVFLVVLNLLFISSIDSLIYFIIRNLATLFATIFTVINIREMKKNILLWGVALYSLAVLYSTYINGGITIQSLIYAVNIFNLFMACDVCRKKNTINVAITLIKIYILALCLINDFFLFFYTNVQWPDLYFLGNKFFVCYYHLVLLCLLIA